MSESQKPSKILEGTGNWTKPEDEQNSDKTTKQGREAGGIPYESASPIGHDLEKHIAAEETPGGQHADSKAVQPGGRAKNEKTEQPPQPANPKRTAVPRPKNTVSKPV